MAGDPPPSERVIGRYVVSDEIAAGGMATVHIGRLLGPVGFARTVAIKRLHPHFAKDPEFVTMLLDEARLAARIRHPNVVSTLDVVVDKSDLLVVMDYVQGESLARLAKLSFARQERIPLPIVMSVIAGALYGLHAAHEATTEQGAPLCVIHRDVSPQNIMIGLDGVARVLDFGVARATGRIQTTREGTLKGKLAYMSPEQVRGETFDRRSDLYAMAVVLWEMVVGRRLFFADGEAEMLNKVLTLRAEPPSAVVPGLPSALDDLVMKGLRADREARFATAAEMAEAAQKIAFATPGQVGAWVTAIGGDAIAARSDRIAEIERRSATPAGALAGRPPAPSASAEIVPPRAKVASATVIAGIARQAARAPEAPQASVAPTLPDSVDVASQVSEVSLSRTVPRSVPLGFGLAILGGSLFVGALVIAFLALRLRTASEAAPPPPPVASAPSAPSVSAPPPSAPPAESSAAGAVGADAAAPLRAFGASRPAPRRQPVRVGKCSPPYVIDENGIRSPKPECL